MLVFSSVAEAVRAGFSLYDRSSSTVYLVRKMTPAGWALVLVDLTCG
jgi:hypothetical protein